MDEKNKIIVEHVEKGKLQDSLEIGSASKGGTIKVYGNYNEPESFKKKIDEAIVLREYAKEKLGM